jgi:cyclophilin family peptidyl-prolyl cis-trans isomerase/protein-disulfide isomerase
MQNGVTRELSNSKYAAVLVTIIMMANACTSSTPELANTPQVTVPRIPLPSAIPTVSVFPTLTSIPYPPLSASDWTQGTESASITVLLYCDYQLIACANVYAEIQQLLKMHLEEIHFIYRHYPLVAFNDKSLLASVMAESAGMQGRFWEMHELLFTQQHEWLAYSSEDFVQWATGAIAELDGNVDDFLAAVDDEDLRNSILLSLRAAVDSGIGTAPSTFIGSQQLLLPPSLHNLEAAFRLAQLYENQYSSYPDRVIEEGRTYIARIIVEQGEIVLQLFPERSPLGVNSFVFLVEQNWYEGSGMHRVIPGALIESGDPSGTGIGDPGYHFKLETDPALGFEEKGMVALASSGPGVNAGRFFINLAPLPDLNGERTIIGKVISGLELLEVLAQRDPDVDLLIPYEMNILDIQIEVRE